MAANKKIRAMCVFGTRPDAIKMAPVVKELQCRQVDFETTVIVTGQHKEQLEQVLQVFDITPDRNLQIMRPEQTLTQISTLALSGLNEAIIDFPPDVVIAQGDTSTTFIASLAAFYHKIPFAHVEAGLRTEHKYNPFPEEMNRRLTGLIAEYHFAPTEQSRQNLLRENIPAENIWVTGNTGIDALLSIAAREYEFNEPLLKQIVGGNRRLVLITAHRRENIGENLENICEAIKTLAARFGDVEFVYAMHRNPKVRETVIATLSGVQNVHLIDPPDYVPFVKLQQRSSLILTDSGGVQEEAPSLGIPVLVLRDTTERPEGVDAGAARLVGTNTASIVEQSVLLLTDERQHRSMANVINPYGTGQASKMICDALRERLS